MGGCRGRILMLAAATLGLVDGFGTGPAEAQVLLDQNLPNVNLGLGADYLRRGSGYGAQPETANETATQPGLTVLTRPHPEYDPLGIRFGDVRLDAGAGESLGYDSNPLGLPHAKGSGLAVTTADVNLATDRERSGVTTRLSVSDSRYFDLPRQNHTDWTAYLGGYYDIGRDQLQASYTHLNLNILPTSINPSAGNQVIPYQDDVFQLSYTTQFGRFTLIPQVSYSLIRFDQGTTVVTGFPGLGAVNNFTVDNRNELQYGTIVTYELFPGRRLVGVVRGTNGTFTNNPPAGPGQDFNDFEFLAGLDVQTQGAFRYRGLVGYETRQYTSSQIKSQSTPIFEGQVIWTPTQLTTVTLTASRTIEFSINAGTTSFFYTTGRLQADHELRRNIILTGYGQIQYADYQRNQNSTIYDAGLRATYRLSRHVAFSGSYEYLNRTSNAFGNYNESIGLLTLRLDL